MTDLDEMLNKARDMMHKADEVECESGDHLQAMKLRESAANLFWEVDTCLCMGESIPSCWLAKV
jgi:hypothetical protein